MSGALPNTNSETASKEHIQQILHLVGDLEAKALTNHYMPRGAKLLVHCFFDHLGSTLKGNHEDPARK